MLQFYTLLNVFLSVVSEDGSGGYSSPTSAAGNKQHSNHNGGGLPAFAQRFGTHTSSASAYTAAGSSRPSGSYHPITTSGVMPYHLTAANISGAGSASDASSLQWAAVASHGYPNTDGTLNYVPMPHNQTGRNRSNASFSAAASLSACKYTYIIICGRCSLKFPIFSIKTKFFRKLTFFLNL